MFYLVLGFCVMWVCHFAYLAVLDRQAMHLRRRLDARAHAASDRV